MANQSTNLYAASDATNQDSTKTFPGQSNSSTEAGGKLRCLSDSYTLNSALVVNQDILRLCKIPRNSKIVSIEIIVDSTMATTGATITTRAINFDGSLGAVITSYTTVDLNSTGRKQCLTTTSQMDVVTTAEVALVLAPVATGTTSGTTLGFVVQYVTE